MPGSKPLDTSIIGAIVISGLVTALHNRYFAKPLPVFLGIFQGSSFVGHCRLPRDDPLRLVDPARLAKGSAGH
ncbi:hypothetical protein LNP17_30565 [Klebsiella variicola subsp. variicola]|nr:hypothetical protein [Klebsiella variicola subsp. variicola]